LPLVMPKTTFIAKLLLPQVRVAWLPSMLKDGWQNKKINMKRPLSKDFNYIK
jgi:hypothetical protein